MNDTLSRPVGSSDDKAIDYWGYFGRRLVELADIGNGARVLDVGCGQGSSLFPEVEKVGPTGKVVGIDLCRHCMGIALGKVKERKLDNAWILHMDAGHMGFNDEYFDFALSGFVGWDYCFDFETGEFTDQDIRSREIARVLKKGGKFGIASWARQEDIEWLEGIVRRYLIIDEPVYTRESAEGFEQILSGAGFRDIRTVEETESFAKRDKETWWEYMRRVGWHDYFEKLKGEDPAKFEDMRREAFRGLDSFTHTDGIRFSKSVLFAFGTK
jgi:ubiquinone/menaquinone biosynthesis C-methylase UbiE